MKLTLTQSDTEKALRRMVYELLGFEDRGAPMSFDFSATRKPVKGMIVNVEFVQPLQPAVSLDKHSIVGFAETEFVRPTPMVSLVEHVVERETDEQVTSQDLGNSDVKNAPFDGATQVATATADDTNADTEAGETSKTTAVRSLFKGLKKPAN